MNNIKLPYINNAFLIGRATKDSRLLFSKNDVPFCMITVANNRRYKDKKTGEWAEQTNFINVKITGPLAQDVCDRIKKGTPLYIEGSIETYNKEIGGKNITHTVIRAKSVKILSSDTITEEEEFSPPEIPNGSELPPVGEEDEELPF